MTRERTTGSSVVLAVNVVHAVRRGPTRSTAIDKRPVDGRVAVQRMGLVGDRQCDTRHHGGPDKALYAYAAEDAAWWSALLDRDVPPGFFGENLTTSGLDITGAVLGEHWRIGGADGILLEVRMPRTPCENLSARVGSPGFHQRFAASGRVGAYLKVLEPGSVAAGDRIFVEHRPRHDVTVGRWFDRPGPGLMRRMLASDADLAESVRRRARRVAARNAGQSSVELR